MQDGISGEVESPKYGTQETKEALVLAFKVGGAIKKAGADGNYDASDFQHVLPVIPYVGPAFENASLIVKEVKDLDTAELAEIKELCLKEAGELISDEKILIRINAGIEWIQASYKLYLAFA